MSKDTDFNHKQQQEIKNFLNWKLIEVKSASFDYYIFRYFHSVFVGQIGILQIL